MELSQDILEIANTAIKNKVFPGGVVGIVRKDGECQIIPFGNFTYEKDSPVVNEGTMYDVASITKSIPTNAIALKLIDQGLLRLEDRLIDYIPEFINSDREIVLISHLLTYTLDGYGLGRLGKLSADELHGILMTKDFVKRPGEVFVYSNVTSYLLGLVVEKITGKTIDTVAEEIFFRPLKMNSTTFFPENNPVESFPPTEINDWYGLVQGHVHDESAYAFKKDSKIVGHAGLFSTAGDLLKFLEMLLHSGNLNGTSYLSKEIIGEMQTNQISNLGEYTGLGFELNQSKYTGQYTTEKTLLKTGFTGTLLCCDIDKGVAYVILTNRTYPKRPSDSTDINAFRKAVGEIVLNPKSFS